MNADEEYVRARWERVIVCDGSYRHYAKGTILLNWSNHQFYEFKDFSAARAFTKQREREIAEVEEEIALLKLVIVTIKNDIMFDAGCWVEKDELKAKRILAVEQARLAELRRGMKEGSE